MESQLQILALAGRKQKNSFMNWQNCGKKYVSDFDRRR